MFMRAPKAKRQPKLPFLVACRGRLQRLDRDRLLALRAVLDLELDLLVFLEGLEARTLDFREVREEVLAAAIGFDEAEALGVVEPFHGTGAHCVSFRKISRLTPGTWASEQKEPQDGNGWVPEGPARPRVAAY